jgi:CheY-like chemotaxis protein
MDTLLENLMSDQPRRILLVEDDRFLRKAAETTLKQQGYTVITAAEGEEALRVARSQPLDLILLDVIMPKLNGFQVLNALKKDAATAHIPVIILSNLGQDRDVQQAMEAGATAYFIKADLSLQALVQRVDEALAAGGA